MVKKTKSAAAFTLAEVMVVILILVVTMLAGSGYRYYSAMDARTAALHRTAARLAMLLCENWRGIEGSEAYDPAAYLGSASPITATGTPPGVAEEGFNLLGTYKVVLNGDNYYAALSWKDLNTELRALNVIVTRPQRSSQADGENFSWTDVSGNELFKLTTYTPK